MKKSITLTILLILFSSFLTAQNSEKVEKLIMEGVHLHDEKKYDEAIAKYKEALKLEPKSSMALYEMSYSYMEKKDLKKAIKYSQASIDASSTVDHEAAYVILGSALNMSGKPELAIKKYAEGIEKSPQSHLLYYNQALVYYQLKDYANAEATTINAINSKPTHPGSHFLLSVIMGEQHKKVQSILPLYFGLMLEPLGKRSTIMYRELIKQLNAGVEKQDDENVQIKIFASDNNEFTPVETMMGIVAATGYNDENKGKSELEQFVKNNAIVVTTLNQIRKDKTGFWWEFYVDKLISLNDYNAMDAFSYYISQSAYIKDVKKWLEDNRKETENFYKWQKEEIK